MPYVGERPGRPGQSVCAGFNSIFLASKALVDMVNGRKYEEAGLPFISEPTQKRLERQE